MQGVPFSSRNDTSASPTAELGDRFFHIELGIGAAASWPRS